jgi:hypothetical protein
MRGDIYKLPPAMLEGKLIGFHALQVGINDYYILIAKEPISWTVLENWYVYPGLYTSPLPLGEIFGNIDSILIESYMLSESSLKMVVETLSQNKQVPTWLVIQAFKEWNNIENQNT